MRNTLAAVLVFVVLALLAVTDAATQTLAYVGVYPDESGVACEHVGALGPVSMAHVVVTNSVPLREISFSAPIPDCLGGPGAFVFETSPFAITGNSQTGITIDLGTCTTSPVAVLTIYYSGHNIGGECCYWPALAYSGTPWLPFEFVDCEGVTREGSSTVGSRIYTCCESFDVLSPYGPYPSDGATDVSTEVVLAWLLPDERCGIWLDLADHPPYPGPRPNDNFDYFTSYEPPEPLEPNTTYYWQVRLQCDLDLFQASPVWAFTTGAGPVATETSTWGRVKALYGDQPTGPSPAILR